MAVMRASLVAIALWLCVAGTALAQDGAQAEGRYDIALMTVAPGEVYWERFGHNGIFVRDRADGRVTLYHYGIFDFGEKNFFWNFIRGYMTYSMIAIDPRRDLAEYRATGRGVTLQWLALDAAQQDELVSFLQWNARPENAKYRYDYFRSNCSTKVRDALDQVLDGALGRATQSRSRGVTYRMQALRLTSPDVPLALGIDAGLGPYADRPVSRWEEQFVPAELARDVGALRIDAARKASDANEAGETNDATGPSAARNGHALVLREEILLPAELPPAPGEPPAWRWVFAAIGIALAALLGFTGTSRRVGVRRVFGALALPLWLLATTGGAMLLFLWLGTEHVSAWRNANVLLFNPLCVLLIPSAWRALRGRTIATPFARRIALAIVVCAFVASSLRLTVTTPQAIYGWTLAWLPIHLAVLLVMRHDARAAA
jgi:hypothetical protein